MKQPRKKLTKREQEVMWGKLDGHLHAQIADKLGVAKKTVEVHARNLYAKLNVCNRLELVKRCIELGWFTYKKRENEWIQDIAPPTRSTKEYAWIDVEANANYYAWSQSQDSILAVGEVMK